MIYIDPPYNSDKDFVYKDDFKDNLANYQRLTGQKDEEGNPLFTNSDSTGRYHSNWLNMMYPRLKLARNLLKDDGVIFIHISKQEISNVTKICDEIFGEANSLGVAIWDKGNPKGDSNSLAYQHEHIVIYAKNYERFKESNSFVRKKKNAKKMLSKAKVLFKNVGKKIARSEVKQCIKKLELDINPNSYSLEYTLDDANNDYQAWLKSQNFSNGEKAYCFIDEDGEVFQPVSMSWPNKKKAPAEYFIPLIHPLTKKECPVPEKGWRNPPETMKKLLELNLIIFGEDELKQPRRKYLLRENMDENIPSILYFGGSDDNLFSEWSFDFENPKPYLFAKDLIDSASYDGDIVLDFFSGSATTAHALMQLNAEDGGNRKFILVQIPEPTPENSEARKAGYATIAEIGKERIRRAAKKIKEEHPDTQADLGFKVLKLDTSNIKKWNPNLDTLEADLLDAVDNILPDRTPEDLLYEVLIKYGLPLTLPIEKIQVGNHQAFNVAFGSLIACFDENITLETVQAICDLSTPENPVLRVVFRDTSFTDDITKTNAIQRLKQAGIEDVMSI
ncbi:MAG: site-specific DNA-methyltransferase [Thiotrichales bacterium]|nr:site-specific DNA-methyltransferase [Thiotrichales bacterium]